MVWSKSPEAQRSQTDLKRSYLYRIFSLAATVKILALKRGVNIVFYSPFGILGLPHTWFIYAFITKMQSTS